MKKHILIAMLTMIVSLANANNPKWTYFSSTEFSVGTLTDDGNYIWATSYDSLICLFRFDKTTGDTSIYHIPGLKIYDHIFTIVVDKSGDKWIGTNRGLVKFDGITWTTYNLANSGLPSDIVYSLAIDKSGNKWISSPVGLSKFDGTKWTTYKPDGFDEYDDYISSLAIDSSENVWITIDLDVIKFDGTNWTTYTYACNDCESSSLTLSSNSLIIDRNGLKWISSDTYGILKLDDTTWTTYTLPKSGPSSGSAYTIAEDSSGIKWVVTDRGLVKIDGDKLYWYTINNSGIPSNDLRSLTLDKEGNKWISCRNGIIKFDSTKWTCYNLLNPELPGEVKTITIDETGTKWIGTDGGLVKYDGTNWTTFNKGNTGLPINDILTIATDKNGDKWVGTNGYGLAKYDGTNWTIYNSSNSGLPDSAIYAISIDEAGIKWIGTNNGLVKFDGSNWITFNNPYRNIIGSLAIDKSGNKWMRLGYGTIGGILAKFDGTNWTPYYDIPSVSSVAIDENGLIWIGTFYNGLVKSDGTNFTTYNQSNSGLPNNWINTITIDGNGDKWIGAGRYNNMVLSKFDGADFTNFFFPHSGLGFTSIAIDDSGKKWIACYGLVVFDENGTETAVEEKPISSANQGLLFPNPASGNFNISQGAGNVERVEIFNLLGTPMKSMQANSIKKIDINNLQSGIYLVRIKTNEGYRNEKLVVK
jgi:ligand-binding sensor domain-containing protein